MQLQSDELMLERSPNESPLARNRKPRQEGRNKIKKKNLKRERRTSVGYPPCSALGDGTLVVTQRLFRREEAPAVVTRELADLPVFGDLVS